MKKISLCTAMVLALLLIGLLGCASPAHSQAAEYYNQGVTLRDEGRYDEAITAYNKAIETDPNYTNAYINRGSAYIKTEQYDRASADYTRAIELGPEQAVAYNGRGAAYIYTKRYNSAASDFKKAYEIDPDFTQAYTNLDIATKRLTQASDYNLLGVNQANTGDYEGAFTSFCKALEVYPYSSVAYNNLGTACLATEQYYQAVTMYNFAIYLSYDYASAYSGRGLTYIYTEDYEKAITDLDRALEIEDPDEASDWNNKGVALEQLGELEEAAGAYNTAFELEPNNDGIKSNITFLTGVIQSDGKPGGIKGHYLPPQRYWVGPKAEERETAHALITPPEADTFLGGVGLTVKTLTGTWVNNSPQYGLVVSDGYSYWNFDVEMKLEETDPNTGGLHVQQPCTFIGTMQQTLRSIIGPAGNEPMYTAEIGKTSSGPVSGTRDGSAVKLYGASIEDLTFDVDYLSGKKSAYDAASYATWSYTFSLRRK